MENLTNIDDDNLDVLHNFLCLIGASIKKGDNHSEWQFFIIAHVANFIRMSLGEIEALERKQNGFSKKDVVYVVRDVLAEMLSQVNAAIESIINNKD